MARRNTDFQTIRSEGGLLPPDLLRRLTDARGNLKGTKPEDYGLPQSERLNEVITQSWNRLRRHWSEFRAAAAKLPEAEAATGLTNDKWSLPLLRELGYGFLPTTASPEIAGRSYAISRFFGLVPIHLIGCGLSLDRRAARVRGAAGGNPHGLVQEVLNRSHDHLWGMVGNGLRLRILRDNQSLSRQSFLEFDLEAMFSGEAYSDFVLLWLVGHATRFAPRDGSRAETCWLEEWTKEAEEQGTRALRDLRGSVERALQVLGEGLTSHPRNTALREALRSGSLALAEFHGQLLRVVYRLIFLFVAEDRTLEDQALLHPRDDSEVARTARDRYATYYGTARLRDLAGNIKGSRHGDLWRQFQILVGALSGESAFEATRRSLALPALGSYLWSSGSTATLNDSELANHDFLEALRHLAYTRQGKVLRPVDYKNLGAEELGGVYESLLALTPQISADGARFTFAEFAGNERKVSGSYYTPDSLVQCLLDSALDPVVEDTIKGKIGADAEKAILELKVCDPAVGSGHFLVGAAHRLARHLSRVRAQAQGESEPSPLLYQNALRDVIGRCLYGVDLNPMAAELCRVNLWLEALEPGKPLSFLDHHIRVGNSLLGATPQLIAAGVPDDAFNAIEGDEKQVCTALKKRNKLEREGQQGMLHLMVAEPLAGYSTLSDRSRGIDEVSDATLDEIRRKAEQFERLIVSEEYRHAHRVADTWCAAFVWSKRSDMPTDPPTTEALNRLLDDHDALTASQVREVERLAAQYQFFHWHLAFSDVFAAGGFDLVLGNPPWERVKLQEKEWFAASNPQIANARNAAARKRLIAALKESEPELYQRFLDDSRMAEGESHLMRHTGRYPLCGRGDINTYAIFAEGMRNLLNGRGRMGCVLPTGIATDDTTKLFFQDVVSRKSLASLFDFENGKGLFPNVQGNIKFCLFTLSALPVEKFAVAAQLDDPELLNDPSRRYVISAEVIRAVNPNTLNCPTFRSAVDALLVTAIHCRHPILVNDASGVDGNRWRVTFTTMFHMTNDSSTFTTLEELSLMGATLEGNVFRTSNGDYVPLYEAKLVHQFNHRAATFEGVPVNDRFKTHAGTVTPKETDLSDPNWTPLPRFWISEQELRSRCPADVRFHTGFRNAISATADSRSLVATVLPRVAVGNSLPLIHSKIGAAATAVLTVTLNAFATDYVLRQKASGGNLNFYVLKQIPIPDPATLDQKAVWHSSQCTVHDWLLPRALELTYTAWDLESFARACEWTGSPFLWDEDRRFALRCEVDAALFHLYLSAEADGDWRPLRAETTEGRSRLKESFPTPRDAVAYIMDTFPVVRRKDEQKYTGDYRTKRVVLEIYDAMQEAVRTGKQYQTRLDPPPADPRCCHPPRPT